MRRNASAAFFPPRGPAGPAPGPRATKSLYMPGRRLSILPSATYFFSSAGAWASVTSASPRAASARAWPVPTAIVLTLSPVRFSNTGTSTSRSPESWVDVVVERMTTEDGAAAGADAPSRRPRMSRRRRSTEDLLGRVALRYVRTDITIKDPGAPGEGPRTDPRTPGA